MKILVTGAAGFIGYFVVARLVETGHEVIGLDNLNDYYDVRLKLSRLQLQGIRGMGGDSSDDPIPRDVIIESDKWPNYRFVRMNIEDEEEISRLFSEEKFEIVIHLAAQAGVRHSIVNPARYIKSNISGFLNILEGCRVVGVRHLVYASSSSVYGLNGHTPFKESDSVAHPVSLYAATKKSDELMAHVYSTLYALPTTGLRFFTVYGPWGRPDMSPYLFMDAILHDRPIKVFNEGNMLRDFTYIDDIVEGIIRIMDVIPEGNSEWDDQHPDPSSSRAPYRIYNIGNSNPVRLLDYIECIERAAGVTARKEYLPMQPGDVYKTYADSTSLFTVTGFRPDTPLQEGIDKTLAWFREYLGDS